MTQIFHPSMNTVSRVSIFGAVFFGAATLATAYMIFKSPYVTQVDVVREQPVPFSHEHHVRALGLECRYCHTSVEKSAFAGLPPTDTCMTCHSQIWTESRMLEPVRASLRNNEPIRWNRVHSLPGYVYFNHSVHLNKGIGCVSCHGRVDEMPLMRKQKPLTMEWCLDCHRHPEKNIRPKEDVFVMDWTPPADTDQISLGRELIKKYDVPVHRLTDCYTCHR